jgi:hypothetical protein
MKSHFLKFLMPVLFAVTFGAGTGFARGDGQTYTIDDNVSSELLCGAQQDSVVADKQTQINSSLQGTWALDSVEIKQITGVLAIKIATTDLKAQNSETGIFDTLMFEAVRCRVQLDGITSNIEYATDGNKLILQFGVMSWVYDVLPSDNCEQLILEEIYYQKNLLDKKSYKIKITYNKQ